jgi:aspartate/methionine/tyrosine aminotransferase
VAFPRLTTGEDVDAWCRQLVSDCGVLLLPASVYDHAASCARGHFRLGLGRANVAQCLKQLDAWCVAKYGEPDARAQAAA